MRSFIKYRAEEKTAMAFIKFTEGGKSFTPKVSISQRGLIGFNQGAKKRFNIGTYKVCILYYDPETRLIGFEFSNDEKAEGAIKIRQRPIGADIGAKSFLTFFNIMPNGTFSYSAAQGEQENWIVINLENGTERKSGEQDNE